MGLIAEYKNPPKNSPPLRSGGNVDEKSEICKNEKTPMSKYRQSKLMVRELLAEAEEKGWLDRPARNGLDKSEQWQNKEWPCWRLILKAVIEQPNKEWRIIELAQHIDKPRRAVQVNSLALFRAGLLDRRAAARHEVPDKMAYKKRFYAGQKSFLYSWSGKTPPRRFINREWTGRDWKEKNA